ncbi:SMI1/KNR4 family protein [Amnibacterium setariae]|nr:SMI1/KNR4 family protein [Amnibacterium setariae]
MNGSRRTFRGWLRSLVEPPAPSAPPPEPARPAGPSALELVEWVPEAVPGAPRAIAEQVIGTYRAIGRWPLPEDFLEVAAEHQGVRPSPASFDLPGGFVQSVEHLLHFEPDSFSNLVTRRFPLEGVLDDGVIPFAECLGSDVLCFDFREDRDAPSVAYWSVDTGLVPLAASFTAFVALLHD